MSMKSLLQLLSEEDRATKELDSRLDGLNSLLPHSKDAAVKYMDKVHEAAGRRGEIMGEMADFFAKLANRFEIREIRDSKPEKIQEFMQMLMKEARKNNLMESCAKCGIDEIEAHECVDYLEDILEISFY